MIALPQKFGPLTFPLGIFCQERMPLEFTDIHERFDQELLRNTYWHSSTLLNMKRLGKYFDAIGATFDRYNIPADVRSCHRRKQPEQRRFSCGRQVIGSL